MKWIVLSLTLAVPVVACDTGFIDYEGGCAALPAPADSVVPAIAPSPEAPPADKMPSYERAGIKADMTGKEDVSTDTLKDDGDAVPNGGVPTR